MDGEGGEEGAGGGEEVGMQGREKGRRMSRLKRGDKNLNLNIFVLLHRGSISDPSLLAYQTLPQLNRILNFSIYRVLCSFATFQLRIINILSK